MSRYWLILFSILTLPFLLAALPPGISDAGAAGTQDARQFVDNTGKAVLAVLNGSAPQQEKRQQLRKLFTGHVDMDWMGRFVLGQGWTKATEKQREQYLQAYRDYMLARYTTNFSDYAGSNYTITDAKSEANGQFTVGMQVNSPNAAEQETQAGYRVRAENGGFKIIDIIIEGVSLITTQRSEFASVIQREGIDALITQLRSKVSEIQ